jgi:hypothetical protein
MTNDPLIPYDPVRDRDVVFLVALTTMLVASGYIVYWVF